MFLTGLQGKAVTFVTVAEPKDLDEAITKARKAEADIANGIWYKPVGIGANKLKVMLQQIAINIGINLDSNARRMAIMILKASDVSEDEAMIFSGHITNSSSNTISNTSSNTISNTSPNTISNDTILNANSNTVLNASSNTVSNASSNTVSNASSNNIVSNASSNTVLNASFNIMSNSSQPSVDAISNKIPLSKKCIIPISNLNPKLKTPFKVPQIYHQNQQKLPVKNKKQVIQTKETETTYAINNDREQISITNNKERKEPSNQTKKSLKRTIDEYLSEFIQEKELDNIQKEQAMQFFQQKKSLFAQSTKELGKTIRKEGTEKDEKKRFNSSWYEEEEFEVYLALSSTETDPYEASDSPPDPTLTQNDAMKDQYNISQRPILDEEFFRRMEYQDLIMNVVIEDTAARERRRIPNRKALKPKYEEVLEDLAGEANWAFSHKIYAVLSYTWHKSQQPIQPKGVGELETIMARTATLLEHLLRVQNKAVLQ
ncbi:17539_t:CDS:10, partial [Gigaspora rosea]